MTFDGRLLGGIGVLAAIVEAGTFARAGEVLGLSPSGVSRAVARLEAQVGVRLFDRTSRSVTLTEEARSFLDRVMPLLESLEDAAGELKGSARAARGRLRVSLDPWFARMVLAPALPAFFADHPALTLDCIVSNHREEMMAGVDIAVRFGPPDPSSLIALKLAQTSVITVAAPAYLRACGIPKSPEDLLEHEAILFRDPQTGRPFVWEFCRDGDLRQMSVRGRLSVDDPSVAIEACLAGHGIFQSLAIGLEPWLERGELVPLLVPWSNERWPLHAYHVSRNRPPAKVRAFLSFLQSVTSRHGRD